MAKVDIGICIYDITGDREDKASDALKEGIRVLDGAHLGCENYYMELADLKASIEQEFDVKIENA